MKDSQLVIHPLAPIFDADSRVLILGTMPSPASRAQAFYYAHPQNRFWRVMESLFECELPDTQTRTAFLHSHGIAVWDVLRACRITAAADSTIRDPVPNDLRVIFDAAPIRAVFTTGQTAYRYYQSLCLPMTGMDAVALPSTSPANARYRFVDLTKAYSVILDALRA